MAESAKGEREQEQNFPKVQGGGSLILAWQIRNKHVLVVGGGEVRLFFFFSSLFAAFLPSKTHTRDFLLKVAAGRILNVLNADAKVTVVCPSSGLNPEVRYRIAQNEVTHIDRVFQPSDLDAVPTPTPTPTTTTQNPDDDDDDAPAVPGSGPPDMVLVAIDDAAASTQVWKLCKERRIPANIADVPPECDFYFGSVHRDGPLQIMVSTNGKGPRLASLIRKFIARALPAHAGDAVERVGELRRRLRDEVASDPADGPKRMRWISRVSDAYDWDDMCALTDEDITNLLRFYPANKVPLVDVLKAMRGGNVGPDDVDVFDGSFGFSVGV